MCLRIFHLKVEFFLAKRVIVTHLSLKHLIAVILLFLSILGATGYVRHKNVVENSKIEFSARQKLGLLEINFSR